MIATFDVASAMKTAQWERAKGELLALVAMQGAYRSGGVETVEYKRFMAFAGAVGAFVDDVEGEGWHE